MALAGPPRTRRNATAHSYVLETLRAGIMDGSLPGGTRLRQSDIAAQLGVSTTPVREALRDLTAERLVELHPHHGAIVRALELSEVREIYELRLILEPILARRAAEKLDKQTLDRAEAIHSSMLTVADPARWIGLNREFHAILSTPEESSRLGAILTRLRDAAQPYVLMSLIADDELMAHANEDHAEIIALFRAGAVDEVAELTHRHLAATLRAMEESRPADEQPDRAEDTAPAHDA